MLFHVHKPSALVFHSRLLHIAWGGQVQFSLRHHLQTLRQFPPRQAGGTLTPQTSQP